MNATGEVVLCHEVRDCTSPGITLGRGSRAWSLWEMRRRSAIGIDRVQVLRAVPGRPGRMGDRLTGRQSLYRSYRPPHSQAWTQARMTAIPNLLTKNVLFERAL